MKAVVTGGGGFLGRYIVEQLLARGDEVTVFARSAYPELETVGVRLVRGDLADFDAVRRAIGPGCDVVFHVAARAGLWGPWEAFYRTNVIGTQNVIAACRAARVRRLVYTSSPSVVFDNRPHEGCDESLPYPARYESYYPQTKAEAERMVLAQSRPDRFKKTCQVSAQRDLFTVVLRPHLIWGPRDTHILPGLIERARSGQLIQVGAGDNLVDLTYVEDAAQAHLLAADALQPDSPAVGSAYFISQGEPVNLWTWVDGLLARLDIPPVRRRVPLWAARALGGALELAYRALPLSGEPRLTRFLASELAMSHYYDISRARRDLGYEPRYSMDEALERTVAYLRSREHETSNP